MSDPRALGLISMVFVPSAGELLDTHRRLSGCATYHGVMIANKQAERTC